jgi:ribonuclease H2 subunit A
VKECPFVGWWVNVLTADELSWKMLSKTKINLNTISHDSAIDLIRRVRDAKFDVQEIYLDTVGDPKKYREKLERIFPDIPKICVEPKADGTYPIVSAASICAKVTRDNFVAQHAFEEGTYPKDVGSGYPGGKSSWFSFFLLTPSFS